MKISSSCLLVSLLLSCLVTLQAQSGETLVIRDGTLINPGAAPIKNAIIVIEGTRIREVSTVAKTKIPPRARVIDAKGKFISPGLADMHQHLGEGNFELNQGKAKGKLADMVVLDADPLASIRNVRAIFMVIKGGVARDQPAILRGH